jgi:GAF domain-containing protein
VVAIVSPRRTYGFLAAVYPPGRTFSDDDSRLLAAYAGHVGAALDSLVALDSATRNRDTSVALLALAHELAEVTTSNQMAARLATAIIPVVSRTGASVWLSDHDGMVLTAIGGEGRLVDARLDADFVRAGHPLIVDAGMVPTAIIDSLGGAGIERVALAPIVVRGEVLGVTAAGSAGPALISDRDLIARLAGLADQAATALDNARLLERAHHDAFHDHLTGLANRALIEDHVGGRRPGLR